MKTFAIQSLLFVSAITVVAVVTGCGSGDGSFPSRPVTVICPWSPGGGTDQLTRFFCKELESKLDCRFNPTNKTGGGGATGHRAAAQARPDGYTMTMITFELSTMHQMGLSDLTHEDFRPLIQMNADPAAIFVQTDAPWKSLDEFLAAVKAKQGGVKIKMTGTAAGGAWDLARAGLMLKAGVHPDAVVWVPTDGAAPSVTKLLGGHIDAICCSVPEAAAQMKAGQLRALVVMNDERLAEFPDIPTAKEQGVDWSAVGWRGLAVPANTPDDIAMKLETVCQEITAGEAFKTFMSKQGYHTVIRTGDDFATFLKEQDSQWKDVIVAAGYGE